MKEKVKIKGNTKGGIMHIVEDDRFPEGFHVAVELEQREIKYDNTIQAITTNTKSCKVRGELSIVLMIDKEPGQIFSAAEGKIVTKDSLVPPHPDSPEDGLLWQGDKVARDEYGNPIYRKVFYTEDPKQNDVTIQPKI